MRLPVTLSCSIPLRAGNAAGVWQVLPLASRLRSPFGERVSKLPGVLDRDDRLKGDARLLPRDARSCATGQRAGH
jgi:hypothetical protein